MRDPIYADLHVHTRFSPRGKPDATPAAMVRRAKDKGLAATGFADHFTPAPVPGCPFYADQRLSILNALRSELGQVADLDGMAVLVGVEADYAVTSDAHHPDDLDRLDLAWRWAHELGLGRKDLLSAEELLERQRRKG